MNLADRIRYMPCGCHYDAPTGIKTDLCIFHERGGTVCSDCGEDRQITWTGFDAPGKPVGYCSTCEEKPH